MAFLSLVQCNQNILEYVAIRDFKATTAIGIERKIR